MNEISTNFASINAKRDEITRPETNKEQA